MPVIIVLIRIALSAVFAVVGVTKVLDPRGTREAMKNFRSPEALAPVLSFALPIAELAIAVGLLVDRTTGRQRPRRSAGVGVIYRRYQREPRTWSYSRLPLLRPALLSSAGLVHAHAQPDLRAGRCHCSPACIHAAGSECSWDACEPQLFPVAIDDWHSGDDSCHANVLTAAAKTIAG